jgi:hypothetical protein
MRLDTRGTGGFNRAMACCAFALFLLSQLLAPFVGPWRRAFGEREAGENAVVTWSPALVAPGPAAVSRTARAVRWRRGLYVAVGLELIVALAAFDAFVHDAPATSDQTVEWFARDWCRSAAAMITGEG